MMRGMRCVRGWREWRQGECEAEEESFRGEGERECQGGEGGDRVGVRLRERAWKERQAEGECEGKGERTKEGRAASSQGRAGCHV